MKRNKSHRKRRPGYLIICNLILLETGEIWHRLPLSNEMVTKFILIGRTCYNLSMKSKHDLPAIIGHLIQEGMQKELVNES